MDENYLKIGKIPAQINLDELFEGINGNITRVRYLKEGMVYFLSLLTVDNYYHYISKDGFIPIKEKILAEIIGKDRPAEIIQILKEKNIIETKPHIKGHSSRRYRLTSEYNLGYFKEVILSKRISEKLILHEKAQKIEDMSIEERYAHIFNQFKRNNLSVDIENAEIFIKNLGNRLLLKAYKLRRNRDLTYKSLFNYTGRTINILKEIQVKDYHTSYSTSNNRFHSILTSLPKVLRPFLTINNERIGELDLSASQPFLLSTILNEKFMEQNMSNYNLHTIYPELENELKTLKRIIPSNKPTNIHYALGVFLNEVNYSSLNEFRQIDFTEDFYHHIISEGFRLYPKCMSSKNAFIKDREYIKRHIMNLLFERNDSFREENYVIELVKFLYPGLVEFIEQFNQCYSNRKFAYLLQRTEAHLMLEVICKKITNQLPTVPFYTIHDSIITTEKNLLQVKDLLSNTISEVTGKSVEIKSKLYEPFSDVSAVMLTDLWNRIKIKSKKDYDKKRTYILQSNIRAGIDFLIPYSERDYWIKICNC